MKARLVKLYRWATSRQGMHDIGAAFAALTALYGSLHKAGVL